jgi:hypothetical protein
MKARRRITLSILGTAGIILLIISMLDIKDYFYRGQYNEDIIGSADRPTSILVMDRCDNYLLYAATAVIIIITIVLFIVFKCKKKL